MTGNVVVKGTLVMRPNSSAITHTLIFTDIDESDFEGGGGSTPTAGEFPNDIGLWVQGSGALDIQGSTVVPWARSWQAGWAGDEVRAAPHRANSWKSFPLVTGAGEVPGVNTFGYRTELLNLTRNVIIKGTVAGRAHILIDSSAPQTIKYATIRHMGPEIPGFQPDTDVTGRYPLHFHHSSGSRGSIVEGVVVRDSGNRAFVPHNSNGVTFNNTIAYDVVGAAYWWDPPSPANPGLHESDDIVYNGAVAAKVWASESNIHRSTAFDLGAGVNPTVINSVAVGMQGGGKDNSGFFWPAAAEGVWTFVNNRAHNNNAHGSFVWQNTGLRHVINGFTAYFNMKSGVKHGAYNNPYLYKNVELRGNGVPITSIAMGKLGTDGAATQVWKSIDTNGRRLLISGHISNDGSKPAQMDVLRLRHCCVRGGRLGWRRRLRRVRPEVDRLQPEWDQPVDPGAGAGRRHGVQVHRQRRQEDRSSRSSTVRSCRRRRLRTRRSRHRRSGLPPCPPSTRRPRSTGCSPVTDFGGDRHRVLPAGLTDPSVCAEAAAEPEALRRCGARPRLVDVVLGRCRRRTRRGRSRPGRGGASAAWRSGARPVIATPFSSSTMVAMSWAWMSPRVKLTAPPRWDEIGRPVDHQIGDRRQPVEGIAVIATSWRTHLRHPHLVQVVDGGTQPDRLGDR